MTLVEATAGNTGVGLALVAAARGYGLVCVMPEKMSPDKRASLRAMGARVVVTPNAFVSGAGTGGTITGVGRRLKQVSPGVKIVLADPVGSRLADWVETGELGPDGPYEVEGIGASKVPENLDRYPPTTWSARWLAPIDPWLSRSRAPGAAFLAISADKPTGAS